jgi:uncharacterized membrane protein YhaH (DUF805 family)
MDIMHLLFSFQGRIRRLHFWLAAICSGVALGIVVSVLIPFSGVMTGHMNPIFGLLVLVLYALSLWIGLALDVKRCHDRDKSGWFVLIVLIPLIGAIWLFVELGFLDGTPGPNRFGPSPKGIGGPEAVAA